MIELTPELNDALTGVLAELLDGRGNYEGKILNDIEKIYLLLTEGN